MEVNSEENKFKEAYDYFSKVPPTHPLAADAALQKGVTLISLENYSEASSHFSKMAATYKNHPKAEMITYYAGLSYSKQSQWRQASNHLLNLPKSTLSLNLFLKLFMSGPGPRNL